MISILKTLEAVLHVFYNYAVKKLNIPALQFTEMNLNSSFGSSN